jgi:NAD-dependent dihydropyrimidine dehydrogenase PreA subunit
VSPASSSRGELHGVFIRVDVDDAARADDDLARKLEDACPVDIFAAAGGRIEIVQENLDECVLCELCLDAAPPGAVRVVKLYDGGAALERTTDSP